MRASAGTHQHRRARPSSNFWPRTWHGRCVAALLVIAASACFILAGIAIARRATALPLVCLVLGVLLGIGSRLVD